MSTDPTGLRPTPSVGDARRAPYQRAPDRREPDGTVGEPPGRTAGRRRTAPAPPGRSTRPGRAPTRGSGRRARKVRKVHRVVRHLEVWSVAKVAAIFAACSYVVGLFSGYLLWRAADRVGTLDGIEGFFEDAGGYDRFEILGDVVFRSAAGIGFVLALLVVFFVVLGAVLFNLISDLTGGIRMTVIDEDLIVAPTPRRPGPTSAGGERGTRRPPPADPPG